MFTDNFDAIYIINLRSRSDRRSEMLEELGRIGLRGDPRIRFFDAIEASDAGSFSHPAAHGCYLSHLSILEGESGSGCHILILEDDCDFRRNAVRYRLPDRWDVFYGGYAADDPADPLNSNIIGAHCMGYSPGAVNVAASYLRRLLERDFPPDPRASQDRGFNPAIKPPFDGAIVWLRRAHPELKTVFAQITVQRASRSDIAGGNRLDRWAPPLIGVARKLKNSLRRLTG